LPAEQLGCLRTIPGADRGSRDQQECATLAARWLVRRAIISRRRRIYRASVLSGARQSVSRAFLGGAGRQVTAVTVALADDSQRLGQDVADIAAPVARS